MSNSSKQGFFDAGMVAFLVLCPHFVPLPFYSYAIICLAAIVLYLKRHGKTLRDIGLLKNGLKADRVALAIASAFAWAAFMRWVFLPVISYFFTVPDYTEYNFIKGNISNLAITVVAAWIVGGFYEEIVFRGFIGATFEKYTKSFWSAALLSSLLFGAYHWQQGIFGIASATLGGLYWSFIFRATGRNLWYAIISHALFDTISLTLIYLGLLGK